MKTDHAVKQTHLTTNKSEHTKREAPTLSIILPCFNEELIIEKAAIRLSKVLKDLVSQKTIASNSFLYFVDDASQDGSWEIIQKLHIQNPALYKGLKLLNHCGHQKALMAGLLSNQNRTDCALTMDVDLQDDLSVIPTMLERYLQGFKIIYGVKKHRTKGGDSFLKTLPAILFYKTMQLIGINLIYNHADFRLVSKQAIDLLAEYPEVNIFLRGIFPTMGFKSTEVYYDVQKRIGGTSKYSWQKMYTLAIDGITSFSVTPIRFFTFCGFIVFFFSSIMGMWAVINYFMGKVVPGWASIIVAIYFLGGVQLIFLGVIGEYIGKIYMEVKRRPKFVKEMELA